MALPRPKSIFDADPHPSISTGVNIAYPESYRRILGIAVHGRPNEPHQVIMRGAGDQDNENLVDAAAELSRRMFTWLKDHTLIMVGGDTIYGHGDVPLASVGAGLPEFGPIHVNGNVLTGEIEEEPNPKARMQGDPLFIYRKRIHLKRPGTRPLECVPVTMSRGWL
tara:strand:- start:145 stop:642 length:498 start_codon:yes stop_codon:yes gene_type:complete